MANLLDLDITLPDATPKISEADRNLEPEGLIDTDLAGRPFYFSPRISGKKNKLGKNRRAKMTELYEKLRFGSVGNRLAPNSRQNKKRPPRTIHHLPIRDELRPIDQDKELPIRPTLANNQAVLYRHEEALLWIAAIMSDLAYVDPDAYNEIPDNPLFTVIKDMQYLSTVRDISRQGHPQEGIIGYIPSYNLIVVAYKGTVSHHDRQLDALTGEFVIDHEGEVPIETPIATMKGFGIRFQNTFMSVWSQLADLITLVPSAKVLFTGHSLGGAVAQIAAFVIPQLLPSTVPVGLISIEAPRSITRDTLERILAVPRLKQIEESAIRINTEKDLVTLVPTYKSGYRHVGRSFLIHLQDKPWYKKIWTHSVLTAIPKIREYLAVRTPEEKRNIMSLTDGRGQVSRKS